MSIHACNFNSEATLHDPKNASSCLIWTSWARRPSPQGTRRFTTSGTAGATLHWGVQGGIVVAGQHTESVTVVWTAGQGLLGVTEVTSAGCEGDTFDLEVEATAGGVETVGMTFTMYPNPANAQVVIDILAVVPPSCVSKMLQDGRCTAWPTSNRATPFPQRVLRMACTKWSS